MSARRLMVRKSLLALVLAYLRHGITDTSDFNSATSFPTDQEVWSFALDTDLFLVRTSETGQTPLSPGVTIEFESDRAEPSRAMPQVWTTNIRFRVRIPWDYGGESQAQEIAQKIDEALHQAHGRVEVKDFSTTPPTGTSTYLQWNTESRGEWKQAGRDAMTDLILEMEAKYSTPDL